MAKPWKTDLWWESPFNHKTEVRSVWTPPKSVSVHDATLRDGEQTPGVVFRAQEKVEIALRLDEIGVQRIEAGMPAVSPEDAAAIKQISQKVKRARVFAFVRATKADIDKALACGANGVLIEVPISEPKLVHQFNWAWERVLETSVEAINYSKSLGLSTVFFPYDTTRADEATLDRVLTGVKEHSAPDSVGVVDTMGCALPAAMSLLVRHVRGLTGLPVEVHTHNDLGMGVANTLAGVCAGAEVVHVCVNAMGERTGNAALEEVAVALRVLLGIDTGVDLGKLTSLSKYVREVSMFNLARNKPVVGDGTFVRESGIGIDVVERYPLAMFALDPRLVGQVPGIVLGKKSGLMSIRTKLAQYGVEASEEAMKQMLDQVKDLGTHKKGLVTDREFEDIAKTAGVML